MHIRRSPLYCLALAFALLTAQTLGLMHAVLHLPGHLSGHLHPVQVQQAHGGLEHLFAGHDDESTCRLFDQASHGDAVPTLPVIAGPMALPTRTAWAFMDDVPACLVAYFQARGPPSQ